MTNCDRKTLHYILLKEGSTRRSIAFHVVNILLLYENFKRFLFFKQKEITLIFYLIKIFYFRKDAGGNIQCFACNLIVMPGEAF